MSHPALSVLLDNPTPPDIYQAWQRKKTQVEMVRDRGYKVEEDELKAISSQKEFSRYYTRVQGDLNRIYVNRIEWKLSVVYNMTVAKGPKGKYIQAVMTMIDSQFEEGDADGFILITVTPIRTADWFKELKFNIQVFSYNELAINPTKHFLNPPHLLLSKKQRENFYRSTGLQPREMPGISIHNPIVRYYGARLRDVFRIERPPEFSYYIDRFLFYREVKNIPIIATSVAAGMEEAEGEGDVEEEAADEAEEEAIEMEGAEEPL